MSQMVHHLPLALAAFLLGVRRYLPSSLTGRFLPQNFVIGISGMVLLVVGLSFTLWARWHLGANWSGTVALKDDHSLVCTGPYKYVQHPIYSGVLLAICGTAAIIGEWRGVVAFGAAVTALVYKSWIEEKVMREVFPEYEQYRRETAALVPFVF
jgi:protein-S-isoprenylcysteine O-methyltransferase Ste14